MSDTAGTAGPGSDRHGGAWLGKASPHPIYDAVVRELGDPFPPAPRPRTRRRSA